MVWESDCPNVVGVLAHALRDALGDLVIAAEPCLAVLLPSRHLALAVITSD